MKIKLTGGQVVDYPVITMGDTDKLREMKLLQKLAGELDDAKEDKQKELEEKLEKKMQGFLKLAFGEKVFKDIPYVDMPWIIRGLLEGYSCLPEQYTNFHEDAPPNG